jgi:hypothetical protein
MCGGDDIPKGFHRMPDGSIMADSEHKGGGKVDGLYNDEIEKIGNGLDLNIPVIASDQIDKIVDMVDSDTDEFGFVINTDNSNGSGKHWTAVFIDNDDDRPSIEFFDSLGDAPSSKLIEDMRKVVDKLQNDKYFLFKENMVRHQPDTTDTCGYHAMKFLENRFNGMSFPEASGFKKCMDQSKEKENDILKVVKRYDGFL